MSSNPNLGADNPYHPNYRDPAIFKRDIAELSDQIAKLEVAIAEWNDRIVEKEAKDENVDELKKAKVIREATLRKLKHQKGVKEAEFEGGTDAALAYHAANQHLL